VRRWLIARPEVDPERIGINGLSFGTFFASIAAANEPRIRACVAMSTCLEPGHRTIFEEGSPTFKKRFMYMSGITDEAEFNKFRQTLTWKGHAEKIHCPFLCVVGEADELSPLIYSEQLVAALGGPKRLVVYQESRHSVGNVAATNLGPFPPVMAADWMAARLAGKPFTNERWYVKSSGEIIKTPL